MKRCGPYYTSTKKCKLKQDPTTYLLEWCFKKKQTKKYTRQQKVEVMSKAHKKPPEKVPVAKGRMF